MKKEEPLISVLIPAYNVENYVEEAINSIRSQTYQNLEIIVIDDASTDNTFNILKSMATKDDRLKVFRNKSNQKIVNTLNFGLTQVTGEYIVRMDADDISKPERIAKQYQFLKENPEIDIVGVNVIVIDELGKKIHYEDKVKHPDDVKKISQYVSPMSHIWMTKTNIYQKIGKYRIPSAEDLDFLLRALSHGLKLANLQERLYLVRQRKGNTATTIGLRQMKSIAYVRKLYKERKKNNSVKDSYSAKNLAKAINSSSWEEAAYRKSAKFHMKYLTSKNNNRFKAIINRGLSILFAPKYQGGWIYNRLKFKQLFKRINSVKTS